VKSGIPLKHLCPALLFHDVALVLSDVLQDPLLEDRRHVEVAEQEEPSPIALVHGEGQGLDTVLLQLFHLVLVRRSQELLRKRNSLNYGSRYMRTTVPLVSRIVDLLHPEPD
jgi:hypothetical protein